MSLTERVAAYAARRYDLRVMLRMLGLIAALLLIQVQGPAFATPGIKYVTNDDGPNYWLDDGYGEEPPACVLFGIEPPGSCLNTFFPAGSVTGMYKADTGNWLAIEDMFADWCGKADAPERDWIRVLQTALDDEQAAIALCNEQGLDILELHGGLALLPIAIRLGYDELSMELLHRGMLEAELTQRDLDSLLYLAASSKLPMTTDALLGQGAQLRSTFVLALAEDGLDETEMDRLRPLLANGMHVDRLWVHAFLALASMQDASERQAMLDRGRDIAQIPLKGLGAMPEDRLLLVCLLDPSLLQQLIDNGLDLQAYSDAQYRDLFTLAYQSTYMDFPDLAGEDAAPRLRELFEVMLANGLDLQDLRKVPSHPSYPEEITTLHELVAECSSVGDIGIYDLFSSLGIDCGYADYRGDNALMNLRHDSGSYDADFIRLVQLGADPLQASNWGDTPLQRVLRWGRLGLARQLLRMGVEPDAASCAALGLWPQFEAACAGLDAKENRYLRSFGLYLAASAGREGLREELLAMERPPLQAVIALGDLELLASLLASGEYEYEPRERLPDAIYTAMDQPDPEVLRMLLADQVQRASIEDYRMYITLYHGVLEGQREHVAILLDAGAACWWDMDAIYGQEMYMKQPIDFAVEQRNVDMLELLLAGGADPNYGLEYDEEYAAYVGSCPVGRLADSFGRVKDTAELASLREMLSLMLEHGAHANTYYSRRQYPFTFTYLLYHDTFMDDVECMRLLLDSGADPVRRNNNGMDRGNRVAVNPTIRPDNPLSPAVNVPGMDLETFERLIEEAYPRELVDAAGQCPMQDRADILRRLLEDRRMFLRADPSLDGYSQEQARIKRSYLPGLDMTELLLDCLQDGADDCLVLLHERDAKMPDYAEGIDKLMWRLR